jgi:hypothetical protein
MATTETDTQNGSVGQNNQSTAALNTLTGEQPLQDRPPRYQSTDRAPSYATHYTPPEQTKKDSDSIGSQMPLSSTSSYASAAAINAVMGPAPPNEEKKISRWKRWQQDRRNMREVSAPKGDSDKTWKVRSGV